MSDIHIEGTIQSADRDSDGAAAEIPVANTPIVLDLGGAALALAGHFGVKIGIGSLAALDLEVTIPTARSADHPIAITLAETKHGGNVGVYVVDKNAFDIGITWQGVLGKPGVFTISDVQVSLNSGGFTPPVSGRPVITAQPQPQTTTVGKAVTLSVTATNPESGALHYQWRKDTLPLPNANEASYQVAATTVADAGSYDVIVSNSKGAVTSTAATVAVTTAE